MSEQPTSGSNVTHLKRPSLPRTRPSRTGGDFYRTPDHEKTGLGGVTLKSAEDAMVAAVRMAYDVADSQIARSKRLADRLKGAADRATGNDPDGQKSAEDGVDAASRIVNNAMLSGMSWMEALLAAEGGLVPRLAGAQLRAAKRVLFDPGADADESGRAEGPAPSQGPASRREPPPDVRILLKDQPDDRRAVGIRRWDLARKEPAELRFRPAKGGSSVRLGGRILWGQAGAGAAPTLEIDPIDEKAPAGRWRAAACTTAGEQFGIIEIEI